MQELTLTIIKPGSFCQTVFPENRKTDCVVGKENENRKTVQRKFELRKKIIVQRNEGNNL